MDETIIYLTPQQAKHWITLQMLDSLGVFDVKLGRVTLDFDKDGLIKGVQVTHNYRPQLEK